MLNPKIEKAFNEQINAEIYSFYLYVAMAAWFQGQQLTGFAHWFKIQAQEELTHSLRFYNYVYDRGGRPGRPQGHSRPACELGTFTWPA